MKLKPKRVSPVLSVHTSALISCAGISSLYTKGKYHEISWVCPIYIYRLYIFREDRSAQLAKSTLLTSTLVTLGFFKSFKVCSDAKKREWGAEKTGSYRTYLYPVKLQPWFLNLQWKTCLWKKLQPWSLRLRWKICPWVEHSDGDMSCDTKAGHPVWIICFNHKSSNSERYSSVSWNFKRRWTVWCSSL